MLTPHATPVAKYPRRAGSPPYYHHQGSVGAIFVHGKTPGLAAAKMFQESHLEKGTISQKKHVLNGCFWFPLKGGIGGIFHPPIGRKNATYILPSGGLYATYHLLGEPETTIDVHLQPFSGAMFC